MRRRLPLLMLLVLGALFVGGRLAREQLGLDFTPESLQQFITGLGWKAPAIFVALMVFRNFLLLPSALVLSAGGVAFGAAAGTAFGAIGIVASAFLQYGIARGIGQRWLRERFGERVDTFHRRAAAAGPALVFAATAHPAGPMSAFHWGSGFALLSVWRYALAVGLGAPLRAATYAFFGSTLFEIGTPRFWVATAVLTLAALLPLAHRRTRERMLEGFRTVPVRGPREGV